MTESEAVAKFGKDALKLYTSEFTPLYHALTERKQKTFMKLVCAGPEEKVVGLHMMGRGCDEILQVSEKLMEKRRERIHIYLRLGIWRCH